MELSTGQQVEKYQVEATIGQGGQGAVYRVRHTQLGTEHALKVVLNATPAVKERLLREGRAQAKLRHPNVVSVTDVIEVDGQPGLIMEYVRGPDLETFLNDSALTIEQADLLANGILDAVEYAHRHRFIHRDLKPLNILCAVDHRGVTPKVMDFGLVKALGGDEGNGLHSTRSGMMMGSPHYMSPEQVRSTKSVDERADVWALGVILYQLLTRTVPFDGKDLFEVLASVTSGKYRPVQELRPNTPERMQRAIEMALQIDADERVPSAALLRKLWRGEITDLSATGETLAGSGAWGEVLERYKGDAPATLPPSQLGATWGDATIDDHLETQDAAASAQPTLQPEAITSATLAPDLGEPTKVEVVSSAQSSSKLPYAIAAGAVLLLSLLGVGVVGSLGLGATLMQSGTESPDLEAAPAAVVPPEAPADKGDDPPPEADPIEADAAGTAEVAPEVAAEPEPETTEAAAPPPEPTPTPEPKPTPQPEPTPAPSAAKAEPTPPPPTPPPVGTFEVRGAPSGKVVLDNGRGKQLAPGASVPAGRWSVLLIGTDGTSSTVKSFRLQAGQNVTVNCVREACKVVSP